MTLINKFRSIFVTLVLGVFSSICCATSLQQEVDTSAISNLLDQVNQNQIESPNGMATTLHWVATLIDKVEDPTYKGKKCIDIGQAFFNNQMYDSAILYTEYAIEVLKLTDLKASLSSAYYNSGTFRTLLREPSSRAIKDLKIALGIASEIKDSLTVCMSYRMLGYAHSLNGNNEQAIITLKEGIEKNKHFSNKAYRASLFLALGLIYLDVEEYLSALDSFLKGKSILEQTIHPALESEMYNNLALVYESLQMNDSAMHYLKKDFELYMKTEDPLSLIPTIEMIGKVFMNMGQYDSAVFYLQRGVRLSEQFEISCSAIHTYSKLGNLYATLGRYDSARLILKQGVQITSECENKDALHYINLELGRLQYLQSNYRKAIPIFQQFLNDLSDSQDYRNLEADAHNMLYQSFKQLNNTTLALKHLEMSKELNDTLFNEDNTRKIVQIEQQYRYEKEKELLLAQQEKEKLKIETAKERAQSNQQLAMIGIVFVVFISVGIFWAFLDRRKRGNQLALLNQELNQSNEKLRSLDNFRTRLFANINHDFRTPLTLIKGYTDQIIKSKDNYITQSTESDLKNLQKNTSILTQMTGEIQNLLLLEEGRLEPKWSEIHLLPMLTLIVNMFDSQVVQQKKSLQLTTRINEDLVLNADKNHFKKILFNLISNAIKHTKTGDTITVTPSVNDGQVILQISDTGEGIDANHLPHIFDRFYQAPEQPYANQEGFGIGLSLVKELVTLHGGQITAESIKGAGATFTICLPFNLDKAAASETNEPSEDEVFIAQADAPEQALNPYFSGQKEKTVLIVDDHEEIRAYIGSILNEDYNVAFAQHGKQALEMLSINKVDLIITDLMMPWLDGFELVDQLSKNDRLKNIPVVVVSARTAEVDKQMILKAGVNDFITKPFEADDLRKRVSNRINDTANIKSNAWEIIANDKNLTSNVEQLIIKKINQLIIDRIDDPNLTVENVALEINASRSKTFRLIKELTQKTPKAYIKDIRLEYVHELIKKGKIKNASEGARAVGMLNGTEFKNQYQSKFGIVSFES